MHRDDCQERMEPLPACVYSPRAHPISAVCPLWCTTPRTPAISDDILVRFVFEWGNISTLVCMVLKTGSTRPDRPVRSVRPSADHGSGHLGWKVFRPVKSVVRPGNRINRTVPRTVRFNSFFSTVAVPRRQDPTLLRKPPSHPPHWKKK